MKALPFVSPKVWKHVELEGVTPVDFTLKVARSLSGKSDVSYRVELDPEETTVHVTSINLHADRASGKVIVEDKQVELRDVHGRAADGKIGVNSTMDFRDKVDQLRFAIEAERLDMHKLPEAWRLPPFIKFDGRLSGKANLLVTVDDHKAWTTGKGEGQIAEVRLFGIKSSKPIPIGLHADGDQFRWNQLQSNGNDASSRQPIPLR